MSGPRLPAREGGVAVKICGLTRPGDAALAAELGAAALGVVLAPSPRRVELARAAELLAAAPSGVARVGVFVDPGPGFVAAAVRACRLDWIQLSGGEPTQRIAAVMAAARAAAVTAAAAGTPVWPGGPGLLRAVHVRSAADLAGLADDPADAFLLDAPPLDGRMGGTGRTFDWSAADGWLPRDRGRIALAGGLTAENLAAAVAAVRPVMVDVSSGVEAAPGIKDPARVEAFMEAARRIEVENAACP